MAFTKENKVQTCMYVSFGSRPINVMRGDTYVFREDNNREIDNGRYFSDIYPTFRKSEFWQEWLKYASACLETGMHRFIKLLL